jgi:hypothetical protein
MKFRVHFVEIFVSIPSIKNIPQCQFSVDITKLRVFTETPHRKSELKQFLLRVILSFLSEKGQRIHRMSVTC